MQKIILFIGIILLMAGCKFPSAGGEETHTIGNPTAAEILAEDHDADIFQYNNLIYVNASMIEWVQEEIYEKGAEISEITGNNMDSDQFMDGTASKLPVGTKVFQTKGNGLLLLMVEKEGKEIIYLGLVEG